MSARYGVGCVHNVMTGREKQKFVRLVSIGVRFDVLVGVKIHSDNYVISLISRSLYVTCAGPILDLGNSVLVRQRPITSIWHKPTNRFDALMCVRSLGLHNGSYTEVSSHTFFRLLTIHGEHVVRKMA